MFQAPTLEKEGKRDGEKVREERRVERSLTSLLCLLQQESVGFSGVRVEKHLWVGAIEVAY